MTVNSWEQRPELWFESGLWHCRRGGRNGAGKKSSADSRKNAFAQWYWNHK